jgi:quercetin dioxygenase-like cupin family protein
MSARSTMAAASTALALAIAGSASAQDGKTKTAPPEFKKAIPNIPGKSLPALKVEYAPGAASVPHTHARSAFSYAYMISGQTESNVNDGETRIYNAGERWSEPPEAIHSISRNASETKPGKLHAVVDSDGKVFTTPLE